MHSTFNIMEIIKILKHRKRVLASSSFIAVFAASIFLFFVTPQYESSTTLLAGNSQLTDKARLFNPQIKDLYSSFGSGDDLDRILSIAEMDTTLKQVITKCNLQFWLNDGVDSFPITSSKALKKIRNKIHFKKTTTNQLIISCATDDKYLSAKIVNSLVEITEASMQSVINSNYQMVTQKLDSTVIQLKNKYTILANNKPTDLYAIRLNIAESETILNQIDQTTKASQEIKLAMVTLPNFIKVVENATPATEDSWPDKPLIFLIAAIAGLLFSSILVLINNPTKAA